MAPQPTSLPGTRTSTTLRQPVQQFSIVLNEAAKSDLQLLDDWLRNVLEVEVELEPVPPQHATLHEPMGGFVWRCLLLLRNLLQAVYVPVFDPGSIVRLERNAQNRSKWNATLAIPFIDHIPLRCYAVTIDVAVKLAHWCMGRQPTTEAIEQLHATVREQVMPLQKLVFAGKSTIPVLQVTHRHDIPFFHLGAGVYQIGWGSKARRMDKSTTGMDSAIGAKLAQNKVWCAQLLRVAGLPAPDHRLVATTEEAVRSASILGWPVVVKPSDLDRGEGVTTAISDDSQLLAAFENARKLSLSKQVIVEREVPGVCHRLFIANGQLLYAVKRLPRSVFGDGKTTVTELIDRANTAESRKPPWLRSPLFPCDELAVQSMKNAGFALEAVPREDERVPLRPIESTAWGSHLEEVTGDVHPDNIAIALRGAELFGLNVAGIDIISPEIAIPWHENGAIINEVNFSPLFGGTDISKRYIPAFLDQFLDGDGRIPIEVVIGGDEAMTLGVSRQQELCRNGTACFLTSHNTSRDPSGKPVPFPFQELFKRTRALLLDKRVDAIILVVQTNEFLYTGLPIDRIASVTTSEDHLIDWKSPDITLSRVWYNRLMTLLAACSDGLSG